MDKITYLQRVYYALTIREIEQKEIDKKLVY